MYTDKDFCNFVKKELINKRMTLKQLVELVNEKYNWGISVSNFSNKLHRDAFHFREVEEILDVLGKELYIISKSDIIV